MKLASLLLNSILFLSVVQKGHAEYPQDQLVSYENDKFGAHMFTLLAQTSGNVFFSPISLHTILALVAQGTSGETLTELNRALRLEDQQTTVVGYRMLLQSLKTLRLHLLMANKIYVQENYKLKESFKRVAINDFISEIETINFTDSQYAADNINRWCMEKTHDKIKSIIKPEHLGAGTRIVLMNAIYFKGGWLHKFSKFSTTKARFHESSTKYIEVDMMYRSGRFNYAFNQQLNAQVLEMKYQNENATMLFLLPKSIGDMNVLEKRVSMFDLEVARFRLKEREVHVSIPRFKIETTMVLNDGLRKMGVNRLFENADFSKLLDSTEPVQISKVIQKTFLDVSEGGSEAAAATDVQLEQKALSIPPPTSFTADRPFIVIIQVKTGQRWTTLFLGRIVQPMYE